jgi:hypothetical protein
VFYRVGVLALVYVVYLGTIIRNQNSTHKEIKSRWSKENACCHLVHSVLSSSLLSKSINIKTYGTNFAHCFVWVWNLVCHIERGTWAEGVLLTKVMCSLFIPETYTQDAWGSCSDCRNCRRVRKIAESGSEARHVCPHGTTRLPLEGFSWFLHLNVFRNLSR